MLLTENHQLMNPCPSGNPWHSPHHPVDYQGTQFFSKVSTHDEEVAVGAPNRWATVTQTIKVKSQQRIDSRGTVIEQRTPSVRRLSLNENVVTVLPHGEIGPAFGRQLRGDILAVWRPCRLCSDAYIFFALRDSVKDPKMIGGIAKNETAIVRRPSLACDDGASTGPVGGLKST